MTIAAAAVTIAALGLAAWMWRRPTLLPEVTRFQINAPPGSTLPLGTPAPSPDGRMLAYMVRGADGVTRLDVRSMASGESRVLPGTDNAVHPFWSPDGRSLAFAADGELKRIDVAGGASHRLTGTESPWHGSWGRDGFILFQPDAFTGKIAAEGGASTPVVKRDEKKRETGGGFPYFLSDSKRFLVEMTYADGSDNIELASLGSMARRLVLPDTPSAPVLASAPNGKTYLLYLHDSSLMAQEFDETAGAVRGSAFLLLDGIGRVAGRSIMPSVGVSAGGVLAYQTGGGAEASPMGWFDRSGKLLNQIPSTAGSIERNLSPDGRFVAMRKRSLAGDDIWLADLERGSATRFTLGPGGKNYANPVWSPDGKRIAYALVGRVIYVKDVNGAAAEQELLKAEGAAPRSWSPDGSLILCWQLGRLFLLPLTGDKKPVPVGPDGGVTSTGAAISPDDKYFAFTSRESGRAEVYVEAMPPGTGKWQISVSGGAAPRWRRDGKELFFVSEDRKLMAVDIQTGQGVSAGVPHTLFQSQSVANGSSSYDVNPDGVRFLTNVAVPSAADAPITVVLNWWAGLKK